MNLIFTKRVVIICLALSLITTACTQATTLPPPSTPIAHTPTIALAPTFTPTSIPIPTATPTTTPVPMSAFMKGVAYTAWGNDEYSSPQSDITLSEVIKPMGVNWITLLVTCYQEKITSTQIQCASNTPTDSALTHAIQYAHSIGIRVMLKPHIDLSNDPGHWRGEINFGSDTTAWDKWFESYTNFITHYAALAQKTDADYFAVGTELPSTSGHADQWRAVINAVRGVYSGLLIYAANHGEEYSVSWWNAVDAIGVDAYYPLTQSNHPTTVQLKAAWAPVVSRLGQLSQKWERPIILTEIGYQSLDGTNRTPWGVSGQTIDLQEQADCYQAVFDAFAGQEWWHGVFWWNWATNPTQGGAFDSDFTANNKQAEDILRVNYGVSPRPTATPTPVLAVDENNQLVIYHDMLGTGWEDWSWDSIVNLTSQSNVYNGNAAITVSLKPGGALSLHNGGVDTSPYYWLEFYINLGKNTQRQLVVYFNDKSDSELAQKVNISNPLYIEGGAFVADQWQKVRIPIAEMGASHTIIVRVNIKDDSGNGQKDFFIDEIRLIGGVPSP